MEQGARSTEQRSENGKQESGSRKTEIRNSRFEIRNFLYRAPCSTPHATLLLLSSAHIWLPYAHAPCDFPLTSDSRRFGMMRQ